MISATSAISPRTDVADHSFGSLEELRELLKLLPAAVTVQDEYGQLLLANDLAHCQFGLPADWTTGARWPEEARQRHALTREAVRAGRPVTCEERVATALGERVLLTTHRPVTIADRPVVLSTSVDLTRQKNIETELYRRANFDELTGLPNRALIEQRMERLLADVEQPQRFALAFLDIDNFKQINDYYGHAVGDALLVEIAKRLGLLLRESDVLSRISGDEFLLLLAPLDGVADVSSFFEILIDRLKSPFFLDGTEVFASASIGISLHPEHGRSYKALRQNADIAMYRAKNKAKGTAAFFNEHMEREAVERTEIEQALRLAILDKRFRCAFQPKVDLRTRQIVGIEALVRLVGDNGVIQAPGAFIGLAVELGLIDELTHLVLGEIVASIDLINDRFGPNTTISVNVAAKQAGDIAFMRSFAKALAQTGFPSRFTIEVTEDAFVSKSHFQTEILPQFRELGVGISIDDFGIGYSSLSALADITADEIKIDRSFIMDIHRRPRSQSILRAVESLSEALGMTVIAEGVETFEELAYLQATTKIRYAQGFYFSEPIFLDELRRLPSPAERDSRTTFATRSPIELRRADLRSTAQAASKFR